MFGKSIVNNRLKGRINLLKSMIDDEQIGVFLKERLRSQLKSAEKEHEQYIESHQVCV